MSKIFALSFLMLTQVVFAEPTDQAEQQVLAQNLVNEDERKVIGYKPIYFAYGEPSTKIQFSFRSELSEDFPLNFGYTQIIFWNLREESKPFEDATYNPELFYRWNPKGIKWSVVDFGIIEHTSNGKAGEDSRSYNQSYVRAGYLKEWGTLTSFISLKAKVIYKVDETNADIRDYVGPFDIDVRLVQIFDYYLDQAELIFTVSPGGKFGTEFDQGGYQIATNFHIRGLKLNPAFYVQYYHGFAETLINYNENVDEFRIGFMF